MKDGLRKNKKTRLDEDERRRRYAGADELDRLFSGELPEDGVTYHVQTAGRIDYLSNIIWALRNYDVMRIFAAAFSLSSADIMIMDELILEYGFQTDILVNDTMPIKHPFEHQMIIDMKKDGKVSDYFCFNLHCKFVLIETKQGEKLVIVTSANGTYNPRMEVETICLDSELFDFYDMETRRMVDMTNWKQTAFAMRTMEIEYPNSHELSI